MANIKNSTDNIVISGTDEDDKIKNKASNVTINSGNGDSYPNSTAFTKRILRFIVPEKKHSY